MKYYKVFLKYLRQNKDKNIPKLKKDLVELHEEWKCKTPLITNEKGLSAIVTTEEEEINDIGVMVQIEDDENPAASV